MKVYMITRSEKHMEEMIRYLNFKIVLTDKGDFPVDTCIWMGWQPDGDHSNEVLYKMLDETFGLEKLGIFPVKSTIFPENLIWDHAYGTILIFGAPEELKTYINRFAVFNYEGKTDITNVPDAFIYKMECEVVDGKNERSLRVFDRGFLYE